MSYFNNFLRAHSIQQKLNINLSNYYKLYSIYIMNIYNDIHNHD